MLKQCRCCQRTYDAHGWAQLPHIGTLEGLEYRNCPCGSTLAVEVVRSVESRPPCELYAGPLTERGVL